MNFDFIEKPPGFTFHRHYFLSNVWKSRPIGSFKGDLFSFSLNHFRRFKVCGMTYISFAINISIVDFISIRKPQNCVSINIHRNSVCSHVNEHEMRRAFRWQFRKFQLKYTKKLRLRLRNQVPVQMMTTELG